MISFAPWLRGAVSLSISVFTAMFTDAAPLITEFVANNSNGLTDGDGNNPDWIEIHNPDTIAIALSGYHLTDTPENLQRYPFPSGTSIPAEGYLIVFASGRAEVDYTDAGGNLHTNFDLRRNGEYLALIAPDGSVAQEFSPEFPRQFEDISYGIGIASPTTSLVAAGASATWLVPTSDIGTTWRDPGFDDSSWFPASTGLGYGYDSPLIGAGGNTRDEMFFGNPSVYIRIPFLVEDPSTVSALDLAMRYEDGFVAYLNGTRVAAANAPGEESIQFDSTATAEHPDAEAIVPVPFSLPPLTLRAGTNILAIQGLNLTSSGSNSNDFLALPELTVTSSAPSTAAGYFTNPTPGAPNASPPLAGFVADTKFSTDRGYFTEPFTLEITTQTPGATIVYTTDGTPPSETGAITYNGPLTISSTTTLRAFATKPGFGSTDIDTQTYLFVNDIIQQRTPSGYPRTWAGRTADYEMDSEIVNNSNYADLFDEAFSALPTLSLVFDPDAFFDNRDGIYQNPQEEGRDWERPLSAEFFVPDGSEDGFQIDAGVRIQGGSSRNPDTPKHSMSLRFRAEYGSSNLRYPLYENTPGGSGAIERFDLLQLRPEYNFGWMHRHFYQAENALYGRDQWASDLFQAMGQNGMRGRWIHLFLNGIYWGLYDLHERPDADYMANYFGGEAEEYDTVNSSVATNGDLVAYNEMMDIAYSSSISGSTGYAQIQEYLDIDAFIDYMMLNFYIGNRDWDFHNWRAARRREPGAHFLFFPWDSEFAASHLSGGNFPNPPDFATTALATNNTGSNGNRRPTGLHQRLTRNAEYRLQFADRVRTHFFSTGALTPTEALDHWTTRSGSITQAIVAESARWGDFRRDVNSGPWNPNQFDLYTPNDHFLPSQQWMTSTYIPQRSAIVLDQFRDEGLYPSTDAPTFSQDGGVVAPGFEVLLTAPATIYFTTNGSDPRLPGGNIAPFATALSPGSGISLTESTMLKARTRSNGGEWSAISEALFTISASDLRITEIMYNPAIDPLSEFLELTNTGSATVSLTGLVFGRGIDFDFADSTISSLAPGERLLLVRNRVIFLATYGAALEPLIAGEFANGTALSGNGETITILGANNEPTLTVSYSDDDPWPKSPDGEGPSLVYIGGDPLAPQNWRPSSANGGNPGTSDSTPFTTGSILTYALASEPAITFEGSTYQLTFAINLTADDAEITIQYSEDLGSWENATPPIISQQLTLVDTARELSFILPGTAPRGFVRLVISERED